MFYLIPNFLHVWVVLNDDCVFHVTSGRCWSAILIGIVIRRARHTAAVEEDLEGGTQVTSAWLHVNAVRVTVESLREDHAIEWTVELDVDTHVCLLALHL